MECKVKNTVSIFFAIIFLMGLPKGFAQNQKIDSLVLALDNHQANDTTKVHILHALATYYSEKDAQKALDYVVVSESISETLNFKKGIAESRYLRGIFEMEQYNFNEAINHFNASSQLYEEIGDKTKLAECFTKLGNCYYKSNDFRNAIPYFKKAVAIDHKEGHFQTEAINLKFIGYSYFDLSEYDEARAYFDEALAINLKLGYLEEASSCYNIIGAIYSKRDNYPVALEFYNKSLAISEKIKDTLGISKVLNNIAILYKIHGKYDKALENYNKSYAIHSQLGNEEQIAVLLNNIGSIYLKKEDYDKALTYYNNALLLNRKLNRKINISRNLTNIGNTYLTIEKYKLAEKYYTESKLVALEINYQMGICNNYRGLAASLLLQKRYNEALSNALKSRELARKIKVLNYEKDISHLLSDIYKNKGNYKNALINHQEYKILSDSIFNKESIEKMTQLEYEYKYKQALDSASIRELKLTKTVLSTSEDLEKSKRNYLWAIIGVLLISIVSGTAIFYQKLNNAKAVTQNAIVEQKLLRSQMTPHFIFNSLAVLQGMILNKEEGKSVSYLSKFSKLLRLTLENSRDKMVFLSKELEALENYIQLQNLESDTLRFSIDMADTVDPSALKIPPMLIQPFVENAVEHAFRNQSDKKEIKLELSFQDAALKCVILDNGVGIDATSQARSPHKTSLSTLINRERLQFLSKDFKTKGSITIEDRKKYGNQGTMVTMIIPYQNTTIT